MAKCDGQATSQRMWCTGSRDQFRENGTLCWDVGEDLEQLLTATTWKCRLIAKYFGYISSFKWCLNGGERTRITAETFLTTQWEQWGNGQPLLKTTAKKNHPHVQSSDVAEGESKISTSTPRLGLLRPCPQTYHQSRPLNSPGPRLSLRKL